MRLLFAATHNTVSPEMRRLPPLTAIEAFVAVARTGPVKAAAEELALDRHNKSPNWLFGDGHVKNAPLGTLWKPGADNAFWPNPK